MTPVLEVKVGDVISVNAGYRPLDDEDCEVLEVKDSESVFGTPQRSFLIRPVAKWASSTEPHWYNVPLEMVY